MEEVSLVAVGQPLHDLPHDGGVEALGELDEARVEQTHQVVLHEVEHQVEGALVLAEVHRLLLVRHDLPQLDDVLVLELPQDLDLPDRSDGETLLLVLQADLGMGMRMREPNSSINQ